jgi:membrane associated rhomboid family serine protease
MWNEDDRDHGSYDSEFEGRPRFAFAKPTTTKVVRALLIANVVVFVLQSILRAASPGFYNDCLSVFGLSWDGAVMHLWVWQFVTYLFLHHVDHLFHILFNLLTLWMFGCEVESRLGPRRFLALYLCGGIFAGLAFATWHAFGQMFDVAVGASGAVMAILVAFTLLAPNRVVLLFFVLPMRMKTLMWGLIGVDLCMLMLVEDGGIANTAHLGGALFGYLWFRLGPGVGRVLAGVEAGRQQKDRLKEAEVKEEVDRLLVKIKEQGMTSLTSKERRFLQNASRRFFDAG